MPDTIVKVAFRSNGSPASAPDGTYPIIPSAVVMGAGERVRYSVRYVNGTLTVAPKIAFVRKAQHGIASASGGIVWTLPVAPTVGNTLVLFVASVGVNQAAPSFSVPTTGGDNPYDRVGGSGYKAEINPGGIMDSVLAAFTHKVAGGGAGVEDTIKVTFVNPGGGFTADAQLVVLEYSRAAAIPVTAFVKAEIDSGGVSKPNPLPALALDDTTGQCVVAGYLTSLSPPDAAEVGPNVPTGYKGRYAVKGSPFETQEFIEIVDRTGLSGFGPETVSLDWTGGATGRDYAAIGFAMTKE